MRHNPNEFYIGWQAEAPDEFARRIKQFVIATCIIVPVLGALMVLNQIGFSASTFEYGKVTEIEGTLMTTPAPFLQVNHGKNVTGETVFQNILLVAPGKHGVQEMLKATESSLGHSLHQRRVKLKGFLIYYDGKTLMEVEEMKDITDQGIAMDSITHPLEYGAGNIIGEITDPKCFFGVMKPGYGKPHRSCAARCIAGGIPPVLKAVSADGHKYYYIVVGENGEAINAELLPFVGDQVSICGEIRQAGDWLVLYRDPTKKIQVLHGDLGSGLAMCR